MNRIILLFDDNRGHQLQLLALSLNLLNQLQQTSKKNWHQVIWQPKLSWLAKLPIFSDKPYFSGLKFWKKEYKKIFANLKPIQPNKKLPATILLSAGHKTARPAAYCKKILKDLSLPILTVHLLSPHLVFSQKNSNIFDMNIRPRHELKYKRRLTDQHFAIDGALSIWDQEHLTLAKKSWKKIFAQKLSKNLKQKKIIGILLGGHSQLQIFNKKFIKQLLADIIKLSEKNILFIADSTRTPRYLSQELSKQAKDNQKLYFFPLSEIHQGLPNPYGGILACCDILISTNDSVNMVTEAGLTEKPLFLYHVPFRSFIWRRMGNFTKKRKRHQDFLNEMLELPNVQQFEPQGFFQTEKKLLNKSSKKPSKKLVNQLAASHAIIKLLKLKNML